jgi:hypothetical protein
MIHHRWWFKLSLGDQNDSVALRLGSKTAHCKAYLKKISRRAALDQTPRYLAFVTHLIRQSSTAYTMNRLVLKLANRSSTKLAEVPLYATCTCRSDDCIPCCFSARASCAQLPHQPEHPPCHLLLRPEALHNVIRNHCGRQRSVTRRRRFAARCDTAAMSLYTACHYPRHTSASQASQASIPLTHISPGLL